MNTHDFVHEMAMVYAALRKSLAKMEEIKKELLAVEREIESLLILPSEILGVTNGNKGVAHLNSDQKTGG